jgi:hypothetical protein
MAIASKDTASAALAGRLLIAASSSAPMTALALTAKSVASARAASASAMLAGPALTVARLLAPTTAAATANVTALLKNAPAWSDTAVLTALRALARMIAVAMASA